MCSTLADEVKRQAGALGFELCGIARCEPSAFRAEVTRWLEGGRHGEMGYMARDPERRLDPARVLPGAHSIVSVGMNYYAGPDEPGPTTAVFARYARNLDYHDVMAGRLRGLLAWLRERCGPGADGRVYVDTGPLLEREVACRAGLGWFGKNTMLINTRRGSYFLLGELLTTVALAPDAPARGGCGACTRCIDACPTGAIVRPYQVDARLCISYLTIEQKGSIPGHLAERMGARVFGCDICQEVCPFNERRAVATAEPALMPRESTSRVNVTDLLALGDEAFREGYRKSPVKRAKRRGLLRNAAAALSSREDAQAIAALEHALTDPEPLVSEQARRSLEAIRARR
ncbi:MAG: tRNA epoxyqueuosine(34) reductase QueG [Chthonomonadales bacterium]|nr:tRNA epoxyqueuosine(34) reductase QueG [Chthonomonadales bacterium]